MTATAPHTPTRSGDPQLEQQVDDEQARLLLERTRVSTWANPPAAVLVVWLLEPYIAPALLGAWFCASLLVAATRLWVDIRARREGVGHQVRWARRMTALLAVNGTLFGMLGWALLPQELPNIGPVMVTTLVAIASIGTVVLSVHWKPCLAFVLPILVPIMVLQLRGDRISVYLGLGIAIYLTLLVIESRKFDAHTRAMLRLRFLMDQLAAEREAALQQALRSDAAKGQFLATMSHEMRTPLHGMLGLVQELQRGGHDEPARVRHLQTVARTGDHLLGIINDVLDFSKIESGHLRLAPVRFELHALLTSVQAMEAVSAAERGLALELHSRLPLALWVHGDATRLRQVLLNLVGNALKFTEAGGVTVRATMDETAQLPPDQFGLVLDVIDTGPGVPAEDRERIFDPFRQLDGSWNRRKGGTGLGLAISRELVRAMGGQLGCLEPEGGRGSRFRLWLPLQRVVAPQTEPGAPSADSAGGEPVVPVQPASVAVGARQPTTDLVAGPAGSGTAGRVLLAEDNEVNAIVACAMLERGGYGVTRAHDGIEAVALAARAQHDVILMDCQMPGLDGFEATLRIRQAEAAAGRRRTPIVALTANALEGDRDRCLAVGMDDHLGKPFPEAALLAMLERHLGTRRGDGSGPLEVKALP